MTIMHASRQVSFLAWCCALLSISSRGGVHGIVLFNQQQLKQNNGGGGTNPNQAKTTNFVNNEKNKKNLQQIQRNIFYVAASAMMLPTDWIDVWINPMMEPPPSSPEEARRREVVSQILERGWSPDEGFGIPDNEWIYMNSILSQDSDSSTSKYKNSLTSKLVESEKETAARDPSTYGEITELGARQLFQRMGLFNRRNNKNNSRSQKEDEDDDDRFVFYDLGSGVGRLVVQAYMELPNLKSVLGVELSPTRHEAAVTAWSIIGQDAINLRRQHRITTSQEQQNQNRRTSPINNDNDDYGDESDAVVDNCRIEFRLGDLLKQDLSNVTHIYLASLCFTDDMMHQIARKLINEAPKLQCVATLRKFPNHLGEELLLRDDLSNRRDRKALQPQSHRVEMTWTKVQGTGCVVYFYHPSKSR